MQAALLALALSKSSVIRGLRWTPDFAGAYGGSILGYTVAESNTTAFASLKQGVIASPVLIYSEALRNRNALAMTETELKLIAALASMGLSSQ